MENLLKLYSQCFPERNAENEIKALGNNFNYELSEFSFIIYRVISDDEAEIIDIGTHNDFRNKGFGAKILEKTLKKLENEDIKTIYLEVAENNIEAIKLYEKCGFKKYGLRKNYYDQPYNKVNAILMKKII